MESSEGRGGEREIQMGFHFNSINLNHHIGIRENHIMLLLGTIHKAKTYVVGFFST